MLDRGVEKLSQRAFEAAQRERPERQPSRQHVTLKAISEGQASEEQEREALAFSLATRNGDQMVLTPLGNYILSGYPPDADGDSQTKEQPGSNGMLASLQ